jgi:hypothetical protein
MKKVLLSLAFAVLGFSVSSNAQVILSENFTGTTTPGMPTGWTNTVIADAGKTPQGWVTTTSATSLYFGSVPNTPPHTEYAVVNELSNPGNAHAEMVSPTFSLASATTPYLSYDCFFFEAYFPGPPDTLEQAWVDLSTDGGTTWHEVDSFSATGAWATHYVSLASYAGSANCKIRFNYADNGGSLIGAAVGNISVFNSAANDIAITSVTPVAGAANDYFSVGSPVTFGGVIVNNSSTATISSFQATYKVGAGAAVTSTFSGLSIAPFTTYTFTATTPYTVAATGNQAVTVWVTAAGDPVLSNDTMGTQITGVSFMPNKRLLFEEATGSWCGYCVRGIVYMDSLWSMHPQNVSMVAVHDYNTYDAMAEENTLTQHYDSYLSSMISGFPTVVIDRATSDDPSGILDDYAAMKGNFGFANMNLTASFTGSAVNVSCAVIPALNMSGDYRLALVLTEDSVHGTAGGYAQHNYYSSTEPGGSAGTLFGAGYNFVDSLPVIPATSMYYKFVDRYTVPDMTVSPNGVAGSLPATMTAGTTYNYSFAAVTPTGTETWNVNKMRAVVMLIDNNSTSPTYGQVLNSVNSIDWPLGVTNVTAGVEHLRVFPNPTSNVAHAQFELAIASKVAFTIYDMLGRSVFSVPAEDMTAGGQQINFSTADFAAGNYTIAISTESGAVTERLTVTK